MSLMEQLALLIVVSVVGVSTFIVKWALGLKKIAEKKASDESFKRIQMEVRHDVESQSIDDIVARSNKRHGRE